MGTCGRRALAAALAVAVLAAGCDPADEDAADRPADPGHRPGAAAPAPGFCRVGLPAAWRRAFRAGRLPARPGETLTVHAVGDDGRTAVVDSARHGRRSVLLVRDGARRSQLPGVVHRERPDRWSRHPVLRLAHPATDQLYGAGYDGRYLVFSVSHDPANLSDWTLYLADTHAGRAPRVLARNAVDAHGDPVDSPLLYPVVADGQAAWTAGIGGGRTRLHRYTLATGTDRAVRTGHPGTPLLLGGDGSATLVWPESPAPDTLTELHAVDLASGAPVALPAPLAGIRGPAFIAGGTGPAGTGTGGTGTDGAGPATAAWVGPSGRVLRVWRSGWAHPVPAVRGRNLQWVRVAGPLVSWDDGAAQYAADLRSGSYARLTGYGYTVAGGHTLAIGYPPDGKTGAAVPPTVVDTRTLPALPACSARMSGS